ncbi:C40 family peptidase [Thiothrix subterranea]|uniref:C40 family peptidase n=1 Tax=Thiothrix subterranea TaxID=2735563 RepID=UPI00192C984D|nr:C40 family peptidase [Thiothrix subterranea]QQZ28593.1 C40 family peptidase [Thiothrix subterranea]
MLSHQVSALKYSVLGSAMLTMAGCSLNPRVADLTPLHSIQPDKSPQPPVSQAASTAHITPIPQQPRVAAAKAITPLDKVALCALKQCGKGYCWGGNTPMKGFDCSGLTQYSFGKGANVNIPRTAAGQYKVALKIPHKDANRGDLVFFRTRGQKVSHVGIYLGSNKFVHAPRTGKAITTTKLEGYWKRKLVGFGRIPGAAQPLLPKSVV